MLDFFFTILRWLLTAIQPIIPFLCFVGAWGLIILLSMTLWQSLHRGVSHAQRLHQIPCAHCKFFTGDYLLKCTVHPCMALSEEAINCIDYEEAIG